MVWYVSLVANHFVCSSAAWVQHMYIPCIYIINTQNNFVMYILLISVAYWKHFYHLCDWYFIAFKSIRAITTQIEIM